jgi:glycine betaine/proline transport system substrate-binding protein
MSYLTGGDTTFGPNYGGAIVYTNARGGFVEKCPNVGRLLGNLRFSLTGEDAMMSSIMLKHESPQQAVSTWLAAHQDVLKTWLAGVTTFDGKPGLPVVRAKLTS